MFYEILTFVIHTNVGFFEPDRLSDIGTMLVQDTNTTFSRGVLQIVENREMLTVSKL